ncbi:alpha/beta hydrolase [Paucibacter sediminis]|uniref:Alpha/beta hydrolase n=1 Tax=Paucibacter sediminis TaxID=3019553 RepID=A0AA95NE42_9BURK|nr:alpha/beta hydrolase [Paucibacter sp. S2-9]WIT10458.1 alpha/beta hydrolase [Paucibacter sp. S2-9]
MAEPLLKHVQCLSSAGLHRMGYWEWGARDNPRVLVCVHGLSRQGRDFDTLAQALAAQYRVICPDVVGRGSSDWLANPALYQIPTYVADMVTLLARLDVEQVDWVGTSMGGLIGMGLAALPGNPVRRLVLNDVGPAIEPDAIKRIGSYLGQRMDFASLEEGAAYLRSISAGFGPHSEAAWLALSRPMFKPAGSGVRLHYDPRIAEPLATVTPELAAAGEAMLWRAYDALRCPTLLVRGADSDLLSAATAQAMRARGPKAQLRELAGVGHAPMLNDPGQIGLLSEFLLAA